MGKNVRVKTWEEFKRLAIEKNPKKHRLHYCPRHSSENLTSLKLILYVEDVQYIFTDSAKDNKLRKTEIPIHADKKGNLFIEDADVKNLLRA